MIVYLTPIGFILITTLFYGIFKIKKTKNIKRTLIHTTLLNIILFILASVWWFLYESDGISQVIGVAIYGGSFIIIGTIYTIVLFMIKKRKL